MDDFTRRYLLLQFMYNACVTSIVLVLQESGFLFNSRANANILHTIAANTSTTAALCGLILQSKPEFEQNEELLWHGAIAGFLTGSFRGRFRFDSHLPLVTDFDMENFSDRQFFTYTRLTKEKFQLLLEIVAPHLPPSKHSPAARLAVFLYKFAHSTIDAVSGDLFGMPSGSVNLYFHQVCNVFHDHIRPLYLPREELVLADVLDAWSAVPDAPPGLLGVIDGTECHFCRPGDDTNAHYNFKHNEYTVGTQALVKPDLTFWSISTGHTGTRNDAGKWNCSLLGRSFIHQQGDIYNAYAALPNINLPTGQRIRPWILGDGGYACKEYMVIPYAGHIQDYSGFNKWLSSHRQIVERAFGVLKKRWSLICSGMEYDFRAASKLIEIAVILHNFCMIEGVPVDVEGEQDDQQPAAEPPPNLLVGQAAGDLRDNNSTRRALFGYWVAHVR